MWTWLTRVFRSSSAAQRAEAEGRIEDAARLYLEAGDRAEAVRVMLRAAETARSLEERRGCYVRAYGMARSDELRDEARRGLALVTVAEAESAPPRSEDDRRRLVEAAEDLERVGLFREAARAWQLLEDRDAVVRVLTLAGDVDGIERVEGARDEAERKALRRRSALEGFDALWRSGDRPRALAELHRWVSAHGDDHEARALYDARAGSMLRDGRCELELDGERTLYVGALPVTLGREADAVVRGASVSRRHATLGRDEAAGAFTVEDAGSRAGTTLDGVRIAAPMSLRAGAVVGLGADLALRVTAADGARCELEVERGMDRGRRVVLLAGACQLPCGELSFTAGGPTLAPNEPVSLNGQRVALPFVLVRGDRVEAAGRVLLVG